jgi:predicted RNase H-like nuclease
VRIWPPADQIRTQSWRARALTPGGPGRGRGGMLGAVRVLGVDLAWVDGTATRPANETGVVAVAEDGTVLDAGWTRGVDETVAWMQAHRGPDGCLAMVDASLLVPNERGQRLCETQVGQRYMRWKVAANSTNLATPGQAGVAVRERLENDGWRYDDGWSGPPSTGLSLSECFPYVTLVGAPELGYDVERPVYKRKPRTLSIAEFRPRRAAACDDLVSRLASLAGADPPLRLGSHPVTRRLFTEPSPLDDREYKHREDLIDAALCAWTGLLWLRFGFERCQVLGSDGERPAPTIIAPARPEQRRPLDPPP